MSDVADEVLAALGPGLVDLAGPLLPTVVEALTGPLAETADLLATQPGRPGPALFDLGTTPYPRFLAQVAGVSVPPGYDTEQAREFVAGAGASRRGTAGAMAAAMAATLTGSKRVVLLERDGSPWAVRFITYDAETPNPAATLAAALTQKPIGLVLTHTLATGVVWEELDALELSWEMAENYTWEQLGALVPGTYPT